MSRIKRNNKTSGFQYKKQVKGIVIMLLSVLTLLDSGIIGSILLSIIDFLVGSSSKLITIFIIVLGAMYGFSDLRKLYHSKYGIAFVLVFVNLFLLISSMALNNLTNVNFFNYVAGLFESIDRVDAGLVGYIFAQGFMFLFGEFGLNVLIFAIWFIIVILIIDFKALFPKISASINTAILDRRKNKSTSKKSKQMNKTTNKKEKEEPLFRETETINTKKRDESPLKSDKIDDFKVERQKFEEDVQIHEPIVTKISDVDYEIPSIELLGDYGANAEEVTKELEEIARQKANSLLQTLESFKLRVKISNILIGPNVTKYELQPELGLKVSKFNSLSNDIALALAAKAVRIEAPIPGKQAIGIEIPNDKAMMVGLKQVLSSNKNDYANKLQVGLGKDITGESTFIEINKTPHMLVAGSTGSGKSVCINGIIISLLTKTSPDDVKMIMIDPKKVELTPFNGIPHLLTPVVTEPKKAAAILKKMVFEMEHRYELFSQTNTRNIEGYNKKVKEDPTLTFNKLPYIVIIVDELADLMMVASRDVEESIARLAQMARAAGIHLIIATQRPSTEVITGLIKANIPTRIAFAVSSSIDSRTILDSTGAEKLLGKGDMLVSEQGSNNMVRLQGAFIADEEVMDIVNQITSQFDEATITDHYDNELNNASLDGEFESADGDELDEYYEEVKSEVISAQKASASHIQRRYKVGFNRAQRILDQLEANGVIAPSEGTKPRKVLMTDEEIYED